MPIGRSENSRRWLKLDAINQCRRNFPTVKRVYVGLSLFRGTPEEQFTADFVQRFFRSALCQGA